MNHLVRMEDTPTHKLIVKLEDGTFRTFYLTVQEAEWVVENINSVEPNIILPKSIDPNFPSFYPKRGAWMERMSDVEIERRRRKYTPAENTKDDEEQRKKTAEITQWRINNPGEWVKLLVEAEASLQAKKGVFHSASENVKRNLIWWEAMRMASEKIGNSVT